MEKSYKMQQTLLDETYSSISIIYIQEVSGIYCLYQQFKGIFVCINIFIGLILDISNPISNSHFVSTPHALFLKGDAKNTNIIFSGDSQHLLGGCYTHTPTVTTPYNMITLLEYSEAQLNSIFIQTNDPSKHLLI